MSCPSTRTLPDVALTMPQTMLISVVLPAPFGPSSAKISPRRMSRSPLCNARKPVAYVLPRERMAMIGEAESVTGTIFCEGASAQGYRKLRCAGFRRNCRTPKLSIDEPGHTRRTRAPDLTRRRFADERTNCTHTKGIPMTRDRESKPMFTRTLTSLAIGAVAMYALDPDRGRRRRALARDKARSFVASTRAAVGVTQRDVAHRFQGLRSRARRLFEPETTPDDLQLIER